MGDKWEISEEGAEELDKLATDLSASCQDLINANEKIASITEENPLLGPHKDKIEKCIETINKISQSAKNDTEELTAKIRSCAARIRGIVERDRYNNLGK